MSDEITAGEAMSYGGLEIESIGEGDIETTIGSDAGGWYVEWYREGTSGDGECCRWYGGRVDSRERCVERAKRPPARSWWEPIQPDNRPSYVGILDPM